MDKTPVRKRQSRTKSLATELANEGSETSLRASAFDSQDLMSSFSYSPNNDTQCVGWDPLKYKGSASKMKPKRLLSESVDKPLTLEKSPVCNLPRRKLNKGDKSENLFEITSNLKELNEKVLQQDRNLNSSSGVLKSSEENKCFPLVGIDTSSESSSSATDQKKISLQNKPQEIVPIPANIIESSSDSFFNDDADELLIQCSQMIDPVTQTINPMESRISTSNNNSPLRKVSKINGLNFSNETSSLKKSPKHNHSSSKHNSKNNSSSLKTLINTECDLGNELFDDIFDLDIPVEEFKTNSSPTNTNKAQNHTRSSSYDPKTQPTSSFEKNNTNFNKSSSTRETYKQLPPRNRNEQKQEKSKNGNFENFKGLNRLPMPQHKSEIIKTNALTNRNNQTTNRGSTNESKNKLSLTNLEQEVMQMKCTPEEIEKKRQEAQRRLQQKKIAQQKVLRRNLTM